MSQLVADLRAAHADLGSHYALRRGAGPMRRPSSEGVERLIDLITPLLEPDPSKRLTASGVQTHPFFKGVNWQMLMLRKLEPPYVPQLADADDRGESGTLDVSHFDKKYTLEPPIMSPPRRPLSASMEAQFEALELEYMSPETRNSVRDSMRSTARSTGRSSGRASGRSTSGTQSGGGESLLRFAERQPKK